MVMNARFPCLHCQETVAAIRAQNGNIIMEETTIVGIGRMIVFQDSEGNVVSAMQYDKSAK
jgi:predicted enzyme related to lactoylglutathione lyase